MLKNDESYENVLGYSGTNSKYVKIVESDFYNNGAGIVPNTLDSEGYEPNGWNIFERNNVFWNNYNYFLAGTAFKTVSGGLGELAGLTINYPTGIGIILYGGDGNIVRQNNVFGNYKWGIASFSGPGEAFVANEGDDAKNINNQIVENSIGRDGSRPERRIRLLERRDRRRQLLVRQHRRLDLRPGQRQSAARADLPRLPAADRPRRPGQEPQPQRRPPGHPRRRKQPGDDPRLCRAEPAAEPGVHLGQAGRGSHPPFEEFTPVEVAPQPGELTCG